MREFLTYKTPFLKTTIPPQSDENLNESLENTVKQLDMIIGRSVVDDLTKAAAANARAQVVQFAAMLDERLNAESDDYNACMDTIEALDDNLTAACNEVRRLLAAEEVAGKNSEAHQEDMRKAIMRIAELEVSVDLLKASERKNPPAAKEENGRLAKDLAQARAERKEANKTKQTIQLALNRANVQVSDQQVKLADAEKVIIALTEQLRDEKHRVNALGDWVRRSSGGEGATTHYTKATSLREVTCYICTFFSQSPLLLPDDFMDRDMNGRLNRHWQIKTSNMLDMTVVSSPWGTPIFSKLQHLEQHWNEAITDDLKHRIRETLREECPKLYQRMIDGEKAPLSELRLPARAQDALSAARYTTVAAVARILTPDLTHIIGIGNQMKTAIINALITWEGNWSEGNGLVEEYRLSRLSKLA